MEKQPKKFKTLEQATDMAMWMTFTHRRYENGQHGVFLNIETGEFEVEALRDIMKLKSSLIRLPENHSQMTYNHFKSIYSEPEPLSHWKKIQEILSEIDDEILMFLIICQVPLDKLIHYELSRGFERTIERDVKKRAR